MEPSEADKGGVGHSELEVQVLERDRVEMGLVKTGEISILMINA
jgi:hypothetical protein